MKKYTTDFTNVKNYIDFYDVISDGFDFPSWFGRNPDAIWDLLTGYIEYPADIYIRGVGKLSNELKKTYEIFREALIKTVEHPWHPKYKEYKITYVD